jgi:hypothetical protein
VHLGLLFLADERLGPKSFGFVLPNWNPFVASSWSGLPVRMMLIPLRLVRCG